MEFDKNVIKDKLIDYAKSLDERNWSNLENIFDQNATAEYGNDSIGLKFLSNSRDEIIEMCMSNLNGCGFTQHLLGNFDIKFKNDTAESSCYVRVYHVGKEPNQNEFYEMFGEYKDNWRKINNSWFIMQRKPVSYTHLTLPTILLV